MATTIQIRRSSQSEWTTNNSIVLLAGEIGYETNTGNFKVGDGTNTWANLKYQLPYQTGTRDSALAETLTIDNANDRVGIGESSPTEKLSVGGNATISGTLAVAQNTTLTGDLAVNGGDITTTSGTLNVASTSTTAQTVNVATGVTASGSTKAINIGTGGASGSTTNVNIGSSTSGATGTTAIARNATIGGTLSVTGDVTLTGDVAVNGGAITTSSATATVFNTTATTLNIGQAATAVSIGATGAGSGTTTIRNATTAISGNATIAGTLGVTQSLTATGGINAVTFNGAPSYAVDPASADILSRKSYVDSRLRIGGVVVITAAGGTYPTIGGSFPSAITSGFNTAGLTGVPSGWTATLTGGNLTVAATGGTWFGTFIKRQNDGNCGVEYGYLTGTSSSVWGGLSTFVALTLILVRTA